MLDYIALGILIVAALTLFYGIIVIHDIPYEIAEKRDHPHQDAIHVAGWVSLFTLHAIWPFLWIWATLYKKERGWGFAQRSTADSVKIPPDNLTARIEQQEQTIVELRQAVEELQARYAQGETK